MGEEEGLMSRGDQQKACDPSGVTAMRRLFARQVQAATTGTGVVDLGILSELVIAQYSQASRGDDEAVQFRIVLENMAQGLCLFDGTQRLIVCNQQYAKIYGLSGENVRPGTTLREIVEQRHMMKTTPAMSAPEYKLWRDEVAATNEQHDSTVELLDGRMIAIRHQPMPDGGWMATHEDITERLQSAQDLAHLSRNFAVTGLPNRTTIVELLQEVLNRRTRSAPCAVLLLGLSGLKNVNDTMGRREGDALLRVLSERMRNALQPFDLLGHVSISEFVVIQCEASQPAEGFQLMRRLIDVLEQPIELDGHHVVVGVNGGIAVAVGTGLMVLKKAHPAGWDGQATAAGADLIPLRVEGVETSWRVCGGSGRLLRGGTRPGRRLVLATLIGRGRRCV